MVNNTVYNFVSFNLEVKIFLIKREHQKKGTLKLKTEASQHTLYRGFKKIEFTLYTFVLAKILQNYATFIQNLTPGYKMMQRLLKI